MNELSLTLVGDPRSKKNSMRIVHIAGHASLRPSQQYETYEKKCLWQLKRMQIGIDYPVNVKYTFWMKTRRAVDASNLIESVDDILVKAGVIADDNRDIVAGHDGTRVYWDKQNPRVEIKITKAERYEQWKRKG